MKACRLLPVAALVLLWSGGVSAQDPLKADPGHYKVVFENASVRVLRIAYPAGAKSAMHSHPDAIMIPLGNAKGQFTMPDGKKEDREMINEVALYTPAATHNPANVGATPLDGLLIEFKTPKPGTAALPASRPGMAMKILAEGPRAMAYRSTAEPSFSEPAGSKHDYDQIVVALSAAKMSVALDGKPAKTSWARGDVQFIGRGVPHESKNNEGKPVDFIIVAIK